MLTEEKRNQIAESLNKMAWAALNKYESLKKEMEGLSAQANAAWNVYLNASQAEAEVYEMPFIAHDDVFGDFVVDPKKERTETYAPAIEAEALSA